MGGEGRTAARKRGRHAAPEHAFRTAASAAATRRGSSNAWDPLYSFRRWPAAAGRPPPHGQAGGDEQLLLRAQLVLAASIGAVVFRSAGLEPLASVSEADLASPLRDLVDALLLRPAP